MNLVALSPMAWCGIGFIIFMVVSINIWLFSLLRNRQANNEISAFKRSMNAIRDPYAKEDSQLAELSKSVEKFKKSKRTDNDR
jgi:hypothetical protein